MCGNQIEKSFYSWDACVKLSLAREIDLGSGIVTISMRVCALSTICNFERPTLWRKLQMPWTQSHFDSSKMQKKF